MLNKVLMFLILLIGIFHYSWAFDLNNLRLGVTGYEYSTFLKKSECSCHFPLDRNKGLYFQYSIENVPYIPDISLTFLKGTYYGHSTLGKDLLIDQKAFSRGSMIHSKLEVNDINLTLYYQPINQFYNDYVKLETGINLNFTDRKYSYEISDASNSNVYTDEETQSTLIPSFHLLFRFSPSYWISFVIKTHLPLIQKAKEQFLEGELRYYLNDQIYFLFGYSFQHIKVKDINDCDFNTYQRGFYGGVGIIW